MAKPQPMRQEWPFVGRDNDNITTHAHYLIEDARILQKAIQKRNQGAAVPGLKLLPLYKSIATFVEKVLHQTGVKAWVIQLNKIANA